MVSM
jgi:hypothetical protein